MLENHITRISDTVCQNGTDHDLIILGISQLEDRIQEDVTTNEERLTSLEEATIRSSATLCQYGNEIDIIKATVCRDDTLDIIEEDADAADVSLAEPGLCKAIDTEEHEPFTAAQ